MPKLGKKPARPGAVRLKFSDYATISRLPTPPASFGHGAKVTTAWNMLGNDAYGDCVWAGAAHEHLLWNYEAGVAVPFNEKCVLSDYSAVTGFNPNDPNTDQGTDMQAAASYRKKTGILDAHGKRHKVGAYLAIQPGNLDEHLTAAYIFGLVGLGITFPNTAMDQFNTGHPWDVAAGSQIDGGHYIPLISRSAGMSIVLTWGREQFMTDAFFKANNDESIVYVSTDFLSGGLSPDGFDLEHLNADLAALKPG